MPSPIRSRLIPSFALRHACAAVLAVCIVPFSPPSLAQTGGAGAAAAAQTGTAAVQIDGAWVRPTVPGQKGTGAFMRLTARDGLRLVGVSTPVAGVSEVHEMKMDNNVMKMRAIDSLELPAGKPVQLQPGGYHLMLMDLKQPLLKDTTVPLTLEFKDVKGATSRLQINVPVSTRAPDGAAAAGGASAGGASAGGASAGHGAHKH